MTDKPNVTELLELTTEIVAAHAGNNTVAPSDLPQLIQDVYRTLSAVGVVRHVPATCPLITSAGWNCPYPPADDATIDGP